jgi:hypothetical protein
MKVMSVEEILACEIPEGDLYRGLLILKNAFIDTVRLNFTNPEKRNKHICVAFTSLYSLAQGEYVEKKSVAYLINEAVHDPNDGL